MPSNISDLNTSTGYTLPFKENCGKPQTRYSPGIEKRKSKYPIANYVSTKRLSEPLRAFFYVLSSSQILVGVQEALSEPQWTQAIKEEVETLLNNNTWTIVPLPEGKKAVGWKWVFSIKHKADGTVERYKARLVSKGYTQTYGVGYQETLSPVAKLSIVRVVLSLAANLGWPLHQFDVKMPFYTEILKKKCTWNFLRDIRHLLKPRLCANYNEHYMD